MRSGDPEWRGPSTRSPGPGLYLYLSDTETLVPGPETPIPGLLRSRGAIDRAHCQESGQMGPDRTGDLSSLLVALFGHSSCFSSQDKYFNLIMIHFKCMIWSSKLEMTMLSTASRSQWNNCATSIRPLSSVTLMRLCTCAQLQVG